MQITVFWRRSVLLASLYFSAWTASAEAKACVTDAELEAVVGDQIRSGAFAINAAVLGDRQMCSRISVTTAIQRMVEKLRPQQPDYVSESTVGAPARWQHVDDSGAVRNLGGFLEFSSPSSCETGPRFSTFLSDLADYPEDDPRDIPQLGKITIPPAYIAVVGAPQQTRSDAGLSIRVPVSGRWHGLPVVAVEGHFWNGGDPGGFSILMRTTLREARSALNRAGFNIPLSGNRIIPGGYDTSMSLEVHGDLVSFSCL